jgi:hypothetical protein
MGAKTLNGNDVYNCQGVDLSDIKEIMLNVSIGRIGPTQHGWKPFILLLRSFSARWQQFRTLYGTAEQRELLNAPSA